MTLELPSPQRHSHRPSTQAVVLVVAKAPVPGQAKTRLIPALGRFAAADVAAAALLDTLDAAVVAAQLLGGRRPVVALTGDLAAAARAEQVRASLARCDVIGQRGADFGHRLAAAHRDAARVAGPDGAPPVVQIGMDTPQCTAEDLVAAAALVGPDQPVHAALGPAEDGGWWLLALRRSEFAGALIDVEMSTARTFVDTDRALRRRGCDIALTRGMRDVDTLEDARAVAALVPTGRFAAALGAASEVRPEPAAVALR